MQNILAAHLGFFPPSPLNGMNTLNVNAANTWLAFSFLGNGKTLSKVHLFASALTGSFSAAAEQTLDIFSVTSAGLPNASVDGPTNCDATPAAGWNTWSPAYVTTDGTMYWAVVKNAHATPASNYLTYRFGALDNGTQSRQGGQWGWNKVHTTDGSTWVSAVLGIFGLQVDWNDSTYDGTPFSNLATGGVGEGVYGTTELGNYWTFAGPTINVRGVVAYVRSITSTPSNALRARIYSGSSATPTLVATSTGGPLQGQISGGGYYIFPFAAAQALAAGTYRTVIGTTGADANTLRYNSSIYTIQNLASSKVIMPFGDMKRTYSSDGTTFAETDTEIVPIGWLLDNDSEFTSSGGGGIIMPRVFGGM